MQDRKPSDIKQADTETIHPLQVGGILSSNIPKRSFYRKLQNSISFEGNAQKMQHKLICYYTTPAALDNPNELYPNQIDPNLCTHINVGIVSIRKNCIYIDKKLHESFKQMCILKKLNMNLKVLLWIGGPSDSLSFLEMIKNHANRKEFIRSIKSVLKKYHFDGIDLDWEFPITYNKSQVHFSHLLHEIRREYEREHRKYLLSVAVSILIISIQYLSVIKLKNG